ncbi:MAG: ABC transporter ATP-binding protein/permease [Oscillospiraceae bacterium]|nr:ABC transporter ATP-binding protein/permease [Oscillospiraceae bacterium]
MLPLDAFTEEAETKFKEFGVDTGEVIIAVTLDLDEAGDFGESWLCLTKKSLYCIFANSKDFVYGKTKKTKKNDPSIQSEDDGVISKFTNAKFASYPLSEISASYIDSFTSTNRFFLVMGEKEKPGKTVGIAYSTNSKKQKLFAFLEIMKRIQEDKEVKDDDSIFEQFNIFCPTCGRRYRNQHRKICMNCVDKNMLFTRMFKYFDKHVHRLVFVFVTLLLSSAIALINPVIHGRVFVDAVIGGEELPGAFGVFNFLRGNILPFVIMLFALNMTAMIIGIFRSRSVNKMSIAVSQKMRLDIFSAMQKLSLAYFNNNQTGRLMNRINTDPDVMRGLYTDILPNLIISVVTFIGVTVLMFLSNWRLTLIVFIPVPVIIWIFNVQLPKLWRMFSRRWRRSSSLNNMLGDSLSNIRVVKAFAKEVQEGSRFREYSDRLYQADLKVNITALSIFPVVSLLMGITGTLIWGFGGSLVISTNWFLGGILETSPGTIMSYGELLTFLNYIGMIFGPLQFFTTLTNQITEITNSAQRMFEVFDTPRDITDTENPVKPENIRGEIEFDNVGFHYLANRPILRNMSFKIKPGDYIGLVGHTGAGKSTIANLITRMYDVISGAIKIDGVDIKNIELKTLRNSIAIVSQEIFIFRGTIAENIKYAKPSATMDEIIAASKAANAHDFIVNLPEGYETLVGTGSRSMSGGEQQRISIARALLLDPKILILDEATAAMDTETERLIQQAINILVKGRTTIVIAHRLSTLKECNYLFAIDNGEIAESGSHVELIGHKGIYYKLYKLQSDAMKRVIAGE